MRRAVDRMKKNNKAATFVLQLTAMVDMFTILIVFLLKSFSTSAVNITPQEGLQLPYSSSYTNPVEGLKMSISMKGIFIEDKQVVVFKDGKIELSDLEASDNDFIRPLYEELNSKAEKSRDIANVNEDHEFAGILLMQADMNLPYGVLKKIMYTASIAGYADLKMATITD